MSNNLTPVINMYGPIDRSGYGHAYTGFLRELTKQDKVKILYNDSAYYQGADIFFIMHIPPSVRLITKRNYGKKLILYTMIEAESIPKSWEVGCNLCDAIITPSSHSTRVFSNCQQRPVYTSPLGIDEFYCVPKKREFREPFHFVMSGSLTERKNVSTLYSAFKKRFSGNKNVKLTLRYAFKPDIDITSTENISVVVEDYTKEKVLDLYLDANCFVYPSGGEGYGLPIIEAVATGCPVIATRYSAMCDYIDDLSMISLDNIKLTKAIPYPPYNETAMGANIDPDELISKMEYVMNNYDNVSEESFKASSKVLENYTISVATRSLVEKFLMLI